MNSTHLSWWLGFRPAVGNTFSSNYTVICFIITKKCKLERIHSNNILPRQLYSHCQFICPRLLGYICYCFVIDPKEQAIKGLEVESYFSSYYFSSFHKTNKMSQVSIRSYITYIFGQMPKMYYIQIYQSTKFKLFPIIILFKIIPNSSYFQHLRRFFYVAFTFIIIKGFFQVFCGTIFCGISYLDSS